MTNVKTALHVLWALGATLTLTSIPVTGIAQPLSKPPLAVALNWVVIKVEAPSGKFRLLKKSFIPIATAQPSDLVTLDAPVVREKGKSTIPVSTVFSRSLIGHGVICEPGRRIGQGSIACLADTNGDGRFDHVSSVEAKTYSYNSVQNIGYLVGILATGPWKPLSQPVSASVAGADVVIETMSIRLLPTRLGAELAKGADLAVCAQRTEGKTVWGGPILMDYCGASISFTPRASSLEQPLIAKASIKLHAVDKTGADLTINGLKVGDALYGAD